MISKYKIKYDKNTCFVSSALLQSHSLYYCMTFRLRFFFARPQRSLSNSGFIEGHLWTCETEVQVKFYI